MKKALLFGLIIGMAFGCKTQLVDRTIEFNFTSTEDYCGGAYPPDELIEQLKTPKPFTGTVYIHNDFNRTDAGVSLIFENGKSKKNGFVEGEYFIFKEPKVDLDALHKELEEAASSGKPPIDINCQMMKNNLILGKFTVTLETKLITQNVHLTCDPCEEPKP